MIEAVGHRHFDTFFASCSRLLRPGGRMALQAITIADQFYEQAKNSVDFIQRHIFPGCCIPSITALNASMARKSDLKTIFLDDIGAHYAPTLAAWRNNLRKRWDEALRLGFDETLLRLWEFYFAYCEGGFAEGQLGDVHMLLERPRTRDLTFDPRLAPSLNA